MLLTIYDGIAVSISIYFTKLLVDEAESLWIARQANEPMDYTTFGVLMGGQIAVWIVALATDVLCRPMRTILGTRATYVAQHDLAEKASRVPYRFYEDSTFYNKIEAAEQRKTWPEYTATFLFQAIATILGLVSVAGLLSLFSGWLSLLVIVTAIPYFLSQLRYILDGHELFRYQSSDRRRLEYHAKVLCDRAYAKEVRLFDFAQHWLANYKAIWEKCYRENRTIFLARNKIVLIADIPSIAAAAGIYLFIVLRASQGIISLGDLAMGLAATLQFRGLSPRLAACDEDRDQGTKGQRHVAAMAVAGNRLHSRHSNRGWGRGGMPATLERKRVCGQTAASSNPWKTRSTSATLGRID